MERVCTNNVHKLSCLYWYNKNVKETKNGLIGLTYPDRFNRKSFFFFFFSSHKLYVCMPVQWVGRAETIATLFLGESCFCDEKYQGGSCRLSPASQQIFIPRPGLKMVVALHSRARHQGEFQPCHRRNVSASFIARSVVPKAYLLIAHLLITHH